MIKFFWGQLLIFIDFSLACMFRILFRVNENSSTYEFSEIGVTGCRLEARMSLEKLVIIIFLKDLTSLKVWEGLAWKRTLRSKVKAWWSEMEGSNSEILDATVELDLVIKRSRVWPFFYMCRKIIMLRKMKSIQ